jgi:NitT/TauT family transport system ATP-binding protein
LDNPFPYPRDTKSPEFQRLVSIIHESITTMTLPDLPAEVPVAGQPISRGRSSMEPIPFVPVGQILGLMSILNDSPELSNI